MSKLMMLAAVVAFTAMDALAKNGSSISEALAVRSLRGESPIRCQMPGPACWRAVPGHLSSVPPSSAMALLWTDRSLHRDSEASR